MRRYLVPLIVFGAITLMLGVGLTLNTSQVKSPLVGKPAPEFQAPDLQSPKQSLRLDDIKGQVALINIWASWCTTCLQEQPYLMALSQQGVPIYGIDYKDERPKAKAWLNQYGNAYRAIGFDADGRIGLDWGVYGVPETYVLDRQGIIRHKYIGAITASSLHEELLPLIAKLRREDPAR